jgi:hypothetical protein
MKIHKFKFSIALGQAATIILCQFFLSGCADKDPIQFSDEHMATLGGHDKTSTVSPRNPEKNKLEKPDLQKVEVAVYRELLQRPLWEAGNYSAVFLQGDDDEVAALIKAFPNHVPPIKESSNADLRPNQAPLDKETGKPAIILSVETQEPADNTVQAVGKWFAGNTVSGSHVFILRKSGDDWLVQNAK